MCGDASFYLTVTYVYSTPPEMSADGPEKVQQRTSPRFRFTFRFTLKPYTTSFCSADTGTVHVTLTLVAPVVISGIILPALLGVNLADRTVKPPLEGDLPELASAKRLFAPSHSVR